MSAHPHNPQTRKLISARAIAAWAHRRDEILRKRRETIARLSARPVDTVKPAARQ
jgi:hypothetical protein